MFCYIIATVKQWGAGVLIKFINKFMYQWVTRRHYERVYENFVWRINSRPDSGLTCVFSKHHQQSDKDPGAIVHC